MKRLLGIDYGDVRVGFSVNDELNMFATPIETISFKGNEKLLFEAIEKYIEKYKIDKIVVGMPFNMNGTNGPRVELTKIFIDKLLKKFKIEVDTIDERMTSNSSNRIMHELGVKKDKKKGIVDTIAAVHILQQYMDKQNYGTKL